MSEPRSIKDELSAWATGIITGICLGYLLSKPAWGMFVLLTVCVIGVAWLVGGWTAGALPATGSPSITVEAGRAILSVSQSTDADVTMTGGTLRFVGGSVLDTTGAVTLAGKIEVDTSSFASGTHTLISAGSLADNGAVLPVGVTLSGNSLMLVVT